MFAYFSSALGLYADCFETCSCKDMQWSKRKWQMICELLQYSHLDVICLQEVSHQILATLSRQHITTFPLQVDHFDFLLQTLRCVGYDGIFAAKPDSPCYYMSENSGPDGCAIFWKTNRLSFLSSSNKIIEVYHCPCNQVLLSCQFQLKSPKTKLCVATTHLKAREGAILATLREEQGILFLFLLPP